MAGAALAVCQCEKCGQNTAEIKKRGNSKFLLYVHCTNPECKDLNMSSAPEQQKKLKSFLNADPGPEDIDTWKPSAATHTAENAEKNAEKAFKKDDDFLEENSKTDSKNVGKWAFAGLLVLSIVGAAVGVRISK